MDKPWLSTVIPSYNGNTWFAATLESIVAQGDPGIEVIVVDSSDTDESLAIADRFKNRLSLRAFRRPDLSSWIAKTNFGVDQARADWICMLHKDDIWLPGRAAAVARWIAGNPDAVMHLHAAHIIDARGRRLGTWHCPLPDGAAAVPAAMMLPRLLVQNFIASPTPTIRRAAFLGVGKMDEELWYTPDWDLYLKLAATGAVYYHRQPLAGYRIHGQSMTTTGSRSLSDFRSQMETVLDRHIGRLAIAADATRRLAEASIEVNVALAAAGAGRPGLLPKALGRLLALGPRDALRYLRYSRLVERTYPRLRARLAGGL